MLRALVAVALVGFAMSGCSGGSDMAEGDSMEKTLMDAQKNAPKDAPWTPKGGPAKAEATAPPPL